jgi:hypothetical protein
MLLLRLWIERECQWVAFIFKRWWEIRAYFVSKYKGVL